jgi:maleylacetate reductase
MKNFTHNSLPARVVFGKGSIASLGEEIDRLDAKRALFCCTRGREEEVSSLVAPLDNLSAGLCAIAEQYVPLPMVVEGRQIAKEREADCVVSYGGGTSVGLAKAIALELEIPVISAVTTFSGSETTNLQAILTNGLRVGHKSDWMLPRTIIYDPETAMGVPLSIMIPSGMNAIAHGVEAFYAQGASPVNSLIAGEGIGALASALKRMSCDPDDIEARGDGLYGAWLCGTSLGSAGVALHHKFAHVLGSTFDLEHSMAHTVALPHSVAYTTAGAREAMQSIATALGDSSKEAATALYELNVAIGAPTSLKEIGMPEEGIEKAAKMISDDPYPNPVPVEYASIRAMIEDAWHGRPPTV